MNNIPSNHHYIPQCYLKQFANRQKQLWKRKINEDKVTSCTTAQICYEKDAFKIRTSETLAINKLADENYIELHSFRRQENNYGGNIARILKYSDTPIVIDRNIYYLFLETLITIKRRNPFTRETIVNSISESIKDGTYKNELRKEISSDFEESDLNFDIDSYLDQYIQSKRNNSDKMHDMYLSPFLETNEQSIIASLSTQLYKSRQFILHAPIGKQFITSDNPGVTINKPVSRSLGGFGEAFKFIFPLSPYTSLLVDSSIMEEKTIVEKSIDHKFVDSFSVDNINQLTKSHARVRIFGASLDILRKA